MHVVRCYVAYNIHQNHTYATTMEVNLKAFVSETFQSFLTQRQSGLSLRSTCCTCSFCGSRTRDYDKVGVICAMSGFAGYFTVGLRTLARFGKSGDFFALILSIEIRKLC